MALARRRVILSVAGAAAAALVATGCGTTPFTLAASGPYVYPTPASVPPSLERVAVIITITSRSADDLQVNPVEFAARDADRRLYTANAAATTADATLVGRTPETRGTLPLPVVTLRRDDVLTGFVVFDVPAGVRPVELVWRQIDGDYATRLVAAD
jgi:hypothetical protein